MAPRSLLAFVLTLALLALPSAARGESSSKGGGSKSSSKGGFSGSKPSSGKSKPSTRSAKTGAPKVITVPGMGVARPAPVREDGSAADDVRIRGAYLSETAFDHLPCERREIRVGDRRCWRCDDAWYEKLIYDGRPVYVEVFAPEGAQVERLPEHVQRIRGETVTYFAADDAIYAPSEQTSGGYVVVATSPGFRVDELPDAAHVGAPIVAGGATYYRYLGVYYREVREDDRTYYVASESPFTISFP